MCSPGSLLRQSWVLLDLQSPSSTICDVPMEIIEYIKGQQVYILSQEITGHKIARYIQVHASIWKPWLILDANIGQGLRIVQIAQLHQAIDSGNHGLRRMCLH